MALAHSPRIVTDGLVLALDAGNVKSYPGSGTTWTDLTGNSNNGTLNNGPTFSSDNGGSIVFDGTNDSVSVNNQLDPIAYGLFADSSSEWTVSSFFNSDALANSNRAITGKAGGVGGNATYVVFTTNSNLRVRLRGGTVEDIATISADIWYNVVVTWDGTTSKSYLNGVFLQNNAVGTKSKQAQNFSIGSAAGGGNTRWDGKISQTLVYNRALTAAEVTQNYNALKGRYLN
tara:strand:- start:44 stop:736 length:693 start_codon:yes stop_codon:yes gene_type:complete